MTTGYRMSLGRISLALLLTMALVLCSGFSPSISYADQGGGGSKGNIKEPPPPIPAALKTIQNKVPAYVEGNPSQPPGSLKIEGVPENIIYSILTEGGQTAGSITITNATDYGFDWEAAGISVSEVIVKASDGAYTYSYSGETYDKGLFSVINKIEAIGINFHQISHVIFVYSIITPPAVSPATIEIRKDFTGNKSDSGCFYANILKDDVIVTSVPFSQTTPAFVTVSPGSYSVVETAIPSEYEFDSKTVTVGGSTAPSVFTLLPNDHAVVTIVNKAKGITTPTPSGTIQFEKVIDSATSPTTSDVTQEFTAQVFVKDGDRYYLRSSPIPFSAASPGSTILPPGEYYVDETGIPEGYSFESASVRMADTQGLPSKMTTDQAISVLPGKTTVVTFTNKKDGPTPSGGTLRFVKVLEGQTAPSDYDMTRSFTVNVYHGNPPLPDITAQTSTANPGEFIGPVSIHAAAPVSTMVPEGYYCFDEANLPHGFTLKRMTVQGETGDPVAITSGSSIFVGEGKTVVITVVNRMPDPPTGTIRVEKVIESQSSPTASDSAQTFTLQITKKVPETTLPILYIMAPTSPTPQTATVAFSVLTPGSLSLPAGYYSMEEINLPSGYTFKSMRYTLSDGLSVLGSTSTGTSIISADSIYLGDDETIVVTVTNVKSPDPTPTTSTPPTESSNPPTSTPPTESSNPPSSSTPPEYSTPPSSSPPDSATPAPTQPSVPDTPSATPSIQSAPEEVTEEVILDEPIPQAAPKLPKTGGLPLEIFLTAGFALSASGLAIRRRKNKKLDP
ncbi:MAG: LPXTG cell wall anchor domain-containing protein [Clostridia bacterium]|nr:LPXTG cell wall anchor domain-containing protein [Clostridia bacterium]